MKSIKKLLLASALYLVTTSISYSQNHFDLIKETKKISITDPNDENVSYHLQNISHDLNDYFIHSGSRLSMDGQKLFFFIQNHNSDGKGQEIAVSERMENQEWSSAKLLTELNNQQHNGVHYISHDNQRLLLLAEYNSDGSSTRGVSMTTKQNDGKWSNPEALKIKGYQNKDVCSFYMGSNEDILLLAINQKDSYGEQDIYVSFKTGNKWTKPLNLGQKINGIGSEGAMTLSPDGKTLYFSSNARPETGFGGYDIYKSERLDDSWTNWSAPKNLGFPYNTPHDELYFTFSPNDDYSYLSRHFVDEEGSHHSDIIAIKKETTSFNPSLFVTVYDGNTNKEIKANVSLLDKSTNTSVSFSSHENHPINKSINYTVLVSAPGYITQEQDLILNNELNDTTEIIVSLNQKREGSFWEIENIFFAFDDSKLLETSIPALENLSNIMIRESDIIVEISGHTDSRGNDEYNLNLSDKRSLAVVNYLIAQGIDSARLKHVGVGENKPLNKCTNGIKCSEELHQQNRRVEVEIISIKETSSIN